jgi:hypothetical protein
MGPSNRRPLNESQINRLKAPRKATPKHVWSRVEPGSHGTGNQTEDKPDLGNPKVGYGHQGSAENCSPPWTKPPLVCLSTLHTTLFASPASVS